MYQFLFYNHFFVKSLSFLAQSMLPRYFSSCPVHIHIYLNTYKYLFKRKMYSNFSNILTLKISLLQKNNYICSVHTLGDTG